MGGKRRTGQLLINAINGRLMSLHGDRPRLTAQNWATSLPGNAACRMREPRQRQAPDATSSGLQRNDNPLSASLLPTLSPGSQASKKVVLNKGGPSDGIWGHSCHSWEGPPLASREWRPKILLNVVQCTYLSSQPRTPQPCLSVVLRLRISAFIV